MALSMQPVTVSCLGSKDTGKNSSLWASSLPAHRELAPTSKASACLVKNVNGKVVGRNLTSGAKQLTVVAQAMAVFQLSVNLWSYQAQRRIGVSVLSLPHTAHDASQEDIKAQTLSQSYFCLTVMHKVESFLS